MQYVLTQEEYDALAQRRTQRKEKEASALEKANAEIKHLKNRLSELPNYDRELREIEKTHREKLEQLNQISEEVFQAKSDLNAAKKAKELFLSSVAWLEKCQFPFAFEFRPDEGWRVFIDSVNACTPAMETFEDALFAAMHFVEINAKKPSHPTAPV